MPFSQSSCTVKNLEDNWLAPARTSVSYRLASEFRVETGFGVQGLQGFRFRVAPHIHATTVRRTLMHVVCSKGSRGAVASTVTLFDSVMSFRHMGLQTESCAKGAVCISCAA